MALICHFSALDHGLFIHGIAKLANKFISSLMTPFERSLSKLSENHKIGEFGLSELQIVTG